MTRKKQFAIFFRLTTMTLVAISVLLLSFYHVHQVAWSQAQVSANGQQTEDVQTGNNLTAEVSDIGRSEEEDDDDFITIDGQHVLNSSSHFIYFWN
ncbi:MAG: hypothetical protein M3299_00260 [Thermoproteota archaeon]|nr:hypothetical protein [Thermoproteota archaeon]